MRRNDREIKEFENIVSVMEKCDVCRLAFNTEDYPYILPLNFGMEIEDGKVTLYFHGANEGRKYELMAKDNRVCFEMDCSHRLVTEEESGNCTMEYESVIGQGLAEIVPDEEKYNALCILMKHYHKEEFPFNKNIIPQTTLFKVTVNKVTGKRRMKK